MIYLNSSQHAPMGDGDLVELWADSASDINNLPHQHGEEIEVIAGSIKTKIKPAYSSTAFDTATSDIYWFCDNGWRKL